MSAASISSSAADSRQAGSSPGPWIAGVAGGFALALFASATTRFAVPDESVGYLADAMRLSPFPPLTRPLWGWLAVAAGGLVPAHAVFVLNLVNAFLGAIAAALLAWTTSSIVAARGEATARVRWIAGLGAATVFATSAPVWLVASRGHPAALYLVLALGAFALLHAYRRTARFGFLLAGAFVYAVGIAESPTLLVLAPLVAVAVIHGLWLNHHLDARRVLSLAAFAVVPVGIVALAAADYARLPAADWREFTTYGEVLRYHALAYRDALRAGLPRQGWLILVLTVAIPWVLAYVGARRSVHARKRRRAPSLILDVIVTGLTGALVFGIDISPWELIGRAPVLVMPYVLLASTWGMMLGRWCALGPVWVSRGAMAGRALPFLCAALLVGVAVAAGIRNASVARSTASALSAHEIAVAMLDHLRGRDRVIGAGFFESYLRIEAHARSQPLRIMAGGDSELSGYRRYLASWFEEPERRALALAGVLPVLREWLGARDGAETGLALQPSADVWLAEGYEPVPVGSVYLGSVTRVGADADAVAKQGAAFRALLRRVSPALRHDPAWTSRWPQVEAWMSRIANDSGVYLENAGRLSDARLAYAGALDLVATNESAAANLLLLARVEGWQGPDVDRAQAVIDAASRDLPARVIAARFGHIRSEEAALLVSTEGSSVFRRDVSDDPAWRTALEMYRAGEGTEARRLAESLTVTREDFAPGWILLATIAFEQGDRATLDACVRQMRVLRQEWPEVVLLQGRMALDRGDVGLARGFFERVATLRPGELSVQETLLVMDLQAGDMLGAEDRVRRILAIDPDRVSGQLGLARLLIERDQFDLARGPLEKVLATADVPEAMAELAWVDLMQDRAQDAVARAEAASKIAPRLSRAHVVRGLALSAVGRGAEAVSALETAASLAPEDDAARIYLAREIARQGDTARAAGMVAADRSRSDDLHRRLQDALREIPAR